MTGSKTLVATDVVSKTSAKYREKGELRRDWGEVETLQVG